MITVITAVPGSGKTLSAVEMIVQYVKEGRRVYTNIPLLYSDPDPNNPDSRPHLLIDPSGKLVFPLPENDDWQLAPVGSVVIYDEAHNFFPATAKAGTVTDDRLLALRQHRHTAYDLIYITQDATFVHHDIRKLCGRHIALYRGHGSSVVAKYIWSHYESDPNDRKAQERAQMVVWALPSKLFPLYKSTIENTHKFKLTKKFVFVTALVFFAVFFSGYRLYSWFSSSSSSLDSDSLPSVSQTVSSVSRETSSSPVSSPNVKKDSKELATIVDVVPSFSREYILSTAPPAYPLEGCISYKDSCQCFDKNGYTLEMSVSMCRDVMKKPLPRKIDVGRRNDVRDALRE